MKGDPLLDLMEAISLTRDAPPVPRGILASLKVPWGRVYRQWDAKGNLWIWMNRAELHDAVGPRVKKGGANALELLTGVDIYHV